MRFFALAVVLGLIAPACGSDEGASPPPAADAAPATFEKGTTFPELALEGYLDRNHDGTLGADEFGPLSVRDVLSSSPAADYLLVHVAFGWCDWCWAEAKEQIRWVNGYNGRLAVLQVFVEDFRATRADRADLDFWIQQNKSALPAALEPAETLFVRFGRNATYLLVDVRAGMKILDVGAGPPAFSRIHGVLAEKLGPLPPS